MSGDRISWENFKNQEKSISNRLFNLEKIINVNAISLNEIIDSINIEQDSEVIARLLYLIKSKLKLDSKINAHDWVNASQIANKYVKDHFNAKVIVNAMLVQRLMLGDDELIVNG